MQTQNDKTLKDYIAIILRQKFWVLTVIFIVFSASTITAYLLPSIYRSTATILIEQQEIPQELVPTTITTFADQRVEIISRRVMTRSNLSDIINKFSLYEEEKKTLLVEALIEKMRSNISLNMVSIDMIDPRSGRSTQATIAFTLSFTSKSPLLAQKVTDELASLYLSENLKSRTRLAVETAGFLTDEAERISRQMTIQEQQLAEFKERNSGRLPELFQMNQQLMDRTERDLTEVDRQISTLKEREIYLTSELSQLSPNAILYSESGERILGAADRLKILQAKLISMSAIYSHKMPDLIKVRKEVEALKREVGQVDPVDELEVQFSLYSAEYDAVKRKYSPEHPDVIRLAQKSLKTKQALEEARAAAFQVQEITKPDNPVYIQLQAQLAAVSSEKRALEYKIKQLESKLVLYEDRLTQTPQVEREFRLLSRDYENSIIKYRELKAKQAKAQLSEALEAEHKGERFTMIESPEYSEVPVKPNRLAIVFIGYILALGSGVVVAALRENMDDTVRGEGGVLEITDIVPIASISYIKVDGRTGKGRNPRLQAGNTG
ncbi:MAG: lipopolysaccharide biosynthesis protein [Gammaproteobacteria bacterium]|nr:lipopolysaccharide biosynthesis protein [Gammaproteobacteria bacterium]